MGDDVITNRKAHHHFKILDTYEAGLVLHGTEVKSIRLGHGNLDAAFARIEKGEAFLYQFDIQPYAKATHVNHEAKAVRKLLLHKKEIRKIASRLREKGLTLIPLKLYFAHGLAKVQLGVCRGKKEYDKRQDIAKREADRAIRRHLAR